MRQSLEIKNIIKWELIGIIGFLVIFTSFDLIPNLLKAFDYKGRARVSELAAKSKMTSTSAKLKKELNAEYLGLRQGLEMIEEEIEGLRAGGTGNQSYSNQFQPVAKIFFDKIQTFL